MLNVRDNYSFILENKLKSYKNTMLNSKCLSERITELFSDLSPDKMQFCLFMFAVY